MIARVCKWSSLVTERRISNIFGVLLGGTRSSVVASELGDYPIGIHLHSDVDAEVIVRVIAAD